MAGQIKLLIEKGKPAINKETGKQLRPDLAYYPFWSLEITPRHKEEFSPELKGKIIVTPTYNEWRQLLRDILIHEFRVDSVIGDRYEFAKYKEFFKKIWTDAEQRKLSELDLPDIYKNCKKKEEGK